MELAAELPVIESHSLRAFGEDAKALSVQLDRWTKAGKLLKLRRGCYALPEPFRHGRHPIELVANLLVSPSYVSLERALAIHGMIPEAVPLIQSVTPGRPVTLHTELGTFEYRHVKRDWFFGYREMTLGGGSALVATAEKALLDLVHLSRGEFTVARIAALRLQNLERIDLGQLEEMAFRGGARLRLAARRIGGFIVQELQREVEL